MGDDDPKFMRRPWTWVMDAPCMFATMEADADGDVVTEVVIVSTDIEAPKADAVRIHHGRTARVGICLTTTPTMTWRTSPSAFHRSLMYPRWSGDADGFEGYRPGS